VTEQRIAELLAGAPTLNWHFAFMLGRGLDGPNRDAEVARFVRSHVLRYVGAALIEGYDGGLLAPEPRNASEHRVGEVHVGSVLLHEFDRFDGSDWWRVGELLTPMRRAA
jgi:hypothetical protein